MLGLAGAGEWVRNELAAASYGLETIEYAGNDLVEAMIDKANALVLEKLGEDVDFLVLAHTERMEAIQSRLKHEIDPTMLRQMPKPVIVRRYDQGELDQLEAKITDNWADGGKYCPLCRVWCPLVETKTGKRRSIFDSSLEDEEPIEVWECSEHGRFTLSPADGSPVFEKEPE